ncbi:pseudouridine-5'-phosphate glycosidase [Nocardiopsis sp. CT-R113]|uniref:Pseudouridine-5'-phosphate glycosidase n=1 Tax=Nocardiopsis codii TaxID=3065942 RepID=A0ABU7KBY0_9ACTN|nr:pseudouridine-5'-phosphate glycosidase [Nocardiopsis sp. CT-R113]MEE2039434.1 pseudouridine-5'-phosphate glycosidase [Nocardiopsis sp. CT-R113]
MGPQPAVVVSEEVRAARADGLPVVALETSVVTGGRYPDNLETALAVDAAAREEGAVPARVAVIDGRFRVGVEDAELERLAAGPVDGKLSTRDLAHALHGGLTGGTTVSSSLIATVAAGVSVFAVAGIGGVHRGAETSFDVSTDLDQFTRSPVAVVCAGAKSLLDPGLTLEYLETVGVPVIGYRSDDFPGYYTRSTGHRVPHRLDRLEDVVGVMHRHWGLVAGSSVLVTHPIAEEWSLDADLLDRLVEEALAEARREGASGAGLTPFVLSAISKATDGRSGAVNRAVLLSTTRLAARLAVAEAEVLGAASDGPSVRAGAAPAGAVAP